LRLTDCVAFVGGAQPYRNEGLLRATWSDSVTKVNITILEYIRKREKTVRAHARLGWIGTSKQSKVFFSFEDVVRRSPGFPLRYRKKYSATNHV